MSSHVFSGYFFFSSRRRHPRFDWTGVQTCALPISPPQLLTQVRDGVADIVWSLPGYTPGRFPVSEVFELPFMTRTRDGSSRALWDFAEKNAAKEFAGVRPVALWVSGPYALH